MKLILASSNPNKAKEFNELLRDSNMEFESAIEKLEVIEDGDTFNQNSFKKAKAYFEKYRTPCVADDSGLVVNSLPNMLGVHSARFYPESSSYEDKNKKLIELLKGKEDRSAYFVCVLCFYLSHDEVFFFEGRVHGEIGTELKGSGGFGYDPAFLPNGMEGRTLSELSEWKNQNSHRAKALKEAVIFFKNKK